MLIFFPLCSLLDACHSTERLLLAAAHSLHLPAAFTAVSNIHCRLYPPTRLGDGDLIIELGLLGQSDLASDYSSTPIPPSRFSPLRRGSRILEAKMFIMDCSVRTWEAERRGRKRASASKTAGDWALEDN